MKISKIHWVPTCTYAVVDIIDLDFSCKKQGFEDVYFISFELFYFFLSSSLF